MSVSAANYDYDERFYDVRLGKWLSIDKLARDYPGYSPYISNLCNPITNVDPDGERTFFAAGLGHDPNKPAEYAKSVKKTFSENLGSKFQFLERSNSSKKGYAGYLSDALFVKNWGHTLMTNINDDARVKNAVEDIMKNLQANPLQAGENLNIIGTSMGSVTAAQTAILLLETGKVDKIDNLILGGSPIDKNSDLYKKLLSLQEAGKIGKILYDTYQLPGDNVTGAAGKNKREAFNKGKKVIASFFKLGSKHPHVKAAEDPNFGAGLFEKAVFDDQIEGMSKPASKAKSGE